MPEEELEEGDLLPEPAEEDRLSEKDFLLDTIDKPVLKRIWMSLRNSWILFIITLMKVVMINYISS